MPPRESKADQRFSLHWQHLYEKGSFAGPTMRPWIHIFTVLPGGSHWRSPEPSLRQTLLSGFEVGGWVGGWMAGWTDRWTDGGRRRWWPEEECFSYFHVLLLVARSSTPSRQKRSGVDSSEWRELSAAQYRQYWFNLTYSSNTLMQQHLHRSLFAQFISEIHFITGSCANVYKCRFIISDTCFHIVRLFIEISYMFFFVCFVC